MGVVIRLYRAEWSTNCERVGLALAHKGLETESVLITYEDRSAVEAVSGQGLVPVIEAGGEVVADSTRIIRWLEERHPEPALFPADPEARREVDEFIVWFNAEWKAISGKLEDELERPDADPEVVERLGATLQAYLARFDGLVEGDRDWFFTDGPGAADFIAYPFLKYAAHRDPADTELYHVLLDDHQTLGAEHAALGAWIDRVGGLPRAY
jgi:glutathione S-transferase